jgi:hypothetical protein
VHPARRHGKRGGGAEGRGWGDRGATRVKGGQGRGKGAAGWLEILAGTAGPRGRDQRGGESIAPGGAAEGW